MSDASQGPGWWLASDGKWYSPSQAPGPMPPPPTLSHYNASLPGKALASNLTVGTQIGLVVAAGLNGLLTVAALRLRSKSQTVWDSPFDMVLLDEAIAAEDQFNALSGLTALAQVVSLVVFIVWMWRAHAAGDRLRPGDRKYSKGWTIGAWFIPFANVVLPRRVMTEIERIAIAPREGGRVTQGWRTTRTAVVGWAWWLLSIGGVVFGQIAESMLDGAFETFDMDTAITAYETMAFAAGVTAVGLACAIPLVGKIGKRLSPESFEASNRSLTAPAPSEF